MNNPFCRGDWAVTLTVRETLAMEIFKDCRLLTGEAGLDNRVKNINILEILDDLSHLEPGEFLVTTAFNLSLQSSQQQLAMMEEFIDKKIAVLAIQTGIYLQEVPAPLVNKAKVFNLPIIELPADMSFRDIIRFLLKELLEKETANLDFRQKVNRQLMETYLAKGMLPMIATLSQIIQRPVYLYNALLQRLEAPARQYCTEARSLTAYLQRKNRGHLFKENDIIEICDYSGLADQVLIPIRIGFETHGYLAAHGRYFSGKELISLKQATSICLLELVKKDNALKSKSLEIKELMLNLLEGKNPEECRSLLESLDLQTDTAYRALVISATPGEDKNPGSFDAINRIEHERMAQTLLLAIQDQKIPALTSLDEKNCLLSFVQSPEKPRYPNHRENYHPLIQKLQQDFPHRTFLMGVGNACSGIENIKTSYNEAFVALKAAQMGLAKEKNGICRYDELGYLKLFMEITNMQALQSFYLETIAPLFDYDQKHDAELIPTLKTYMKHLNMNKAAEELYVHRHTLKYRLNKIKE
jgi:PucR family transcriptional regulator, purine catabolism regulatory protein